MTKAHRTLSDSESQRLVEARQRIMVQIIIVGLMLWGASAGLGAQPVETSQLPKKVLPNDPVGNLFNDGPRVVYTQDAGADPIEKLFWDRELKKEKQKDQIQPSGSNQSETKSEPPKDQPIKEEPKLEQAPDAVATQEADARNRPIANKKTEEVKDARTLQSRDRENPSPQNIKQRAERNSVDPTQQQSLKRAADAGRLDGVRINGAQWPVSIKPSNKYGKLRGEGRPWQGLVFEVPTNTEVKAIDAGRVMYANDFKNYGNLVIIDHGDRVASVYANNQKLLVKEGDLIGTGDLIALSGQTGSLEYPALYFEIRKEGKPVDPLQFLKRR